jgi:hypothetical protein
VHHRKLLIIICKLLDVSSVGRNESAGQSTLLSFLILNRRLNFLIVVNQCYTAVRMGSCAKARWGMKKWLVCAAPTALYFSSMLSQRLPLQRAKRASGRTGLTCRRASGAWIVVAGAVPFPLKAYRILRRNESAQTGRAGCERGRILAPFTGQHNPDLRKKEF